MTIADDAKKEDGGKKKQPTMRKKSIKKKKMTDEEIMDALRKIDSYSNNKNLLAVGVFYVALWLLYLGICL